jgi:hypothetical protein
MLALGAATVALSLASAAPPASAVLLECERGEQPAAEFEARMSTAPGAARMKMRFTLQVSTVARPGYRRVAAPGFGAWTTSEPGITRYVYTRRVEALVGPASYRVVVRFRWLDAADRVIARARRTSRPCRQPDLRPNLTVTDLAVEPTGDPRTRRYIAFVRNTGRGTAEDFEVALAGAQPVAVASLAPGRERSVDVVGPACVPDAIITAMADPADAIEERSETDNELSRTCPAASA